MTNCLGALLWNEVAPITFVTIFILEILVAVLISWLSLSFTVHICKSLNTNKIAIYVLFANGFYSLAAWGYTIGYIFAMIAFFTKENTVDNINNICNFNVVTLQSITAILMWFCHATSFLLTLHVYFTNLKECFKTLKYAISMRVQTILLINIWYVNFDSFIHTSQYVYL